jgi:hypothetical protein
MRCNLHSPMLSATLLRSVVRSYPCPPARTAATAHLGHSDRVVVELQLAAAAAQVSGVDYDMLVEEEPENRSSLAVEASHMHFVEEALAAADSTLPGSAAAVEVARSHIEASLHGYSHNSDSVEEAAASSPGSEEVACAHTQARDLVVAVGVCCSWLGRRCAGVVVRLRRVCSRASELPARALRVCRNSGALVGASAAENEYGVWMYGDIRRQRIRVVAAIIRHRCTPISSPPSAVSLVSAILLASSVAKCRLLVCSRGQNRYVMLWQVTQFGDRRLMLSSSSVVRVAAVEGVAWMFGI